MNTNQVNLFELVKKESILFFCYGTLKKGHGNHYHLRDARFIGEYVTEPKYTMIGKGRGFPGVLPNGDTAIHGELYETNDPSVVRSVCGLEGCGSGTMGHPNNWYDLEPVPIEDGLTAYMFVWRDAKINESEIIKDGIWR